MEKGRAKMKALLWHGLINHQPLRMLFQHKEGSEQRHSKLDPEEMTKNDEASSNTKFKRNSTPARSKQLNRSQEYLQRKDEGTEDQHDRILCTRLLGLRDRRLFGPPNSKNEHDKYSRNCTYHASIESWLRL